MRNSFFLRLTFGLLLLAGTSGALTSCNKDDIRPGKGGCHSTAPTDSTKVN